MGISRYQVENPPVALRDPEEIVAYIAVDDPQSADRFGQRLIDQAEVTALHPLAGRKVPEFSDPAVREVVYRRYRIVYRVDEELSTIVISRFWHASRGGPEIAGFDDPPHPLE